MAVEDSSSVWKQNLKSLNVHGPGSQIAIHAICRSNRHRQLMAMAICLSLRDSSFCSRNMAKSASNAGQSRRLSGSRSLNLQHGIIRIDHFGNDQRLLGGRHLCISFRPMPACVYPHEPLAETSTPRAVHSCGAPSVTKTSSRARCIHCAPCRSEAGWGSSAPPLLLQGCAVRSAY